MVPMDLVRPSQSHSTGRFRLVNFLFLGLALFFLPFQGGCAQQTGGSGEMIQLPPARTDGLVSVEKAIQGRRSLRNIPGDQLPLEALAQVLWAGQGVSVPMEEAPVGFRWEWMGGYRTAPSAGALYPLELYVVVGAVEGLEPGLYRYLPVPHALEVVREGDSREGLWEAALRQNAIREAPVTLVFAAVIARTEAKYGERAERYVHIEVGAAAENVYLQCEALHLGTVFMGAFGDDAVHGELGLARNQRVFGIMPLGVDAGG